jgi:16S rRNA (uracil1498-N3)-methyltransferase
MALRRFYIEPQIIQGEQASIRGDLFHHIREVCRFDTGDRFELLPGDGQAWLAEVTSVNSKELQARILSSRPLAVPTKPHLTLCLSLPKLPKVDWIVEKCVELGVAEIRPFVSDYSFLRKASEISPNRMQRWHKLIEGATQQSGRGDLLDLQPVVSLAELLQQFNRNTSTAGLFPYEGEAPVRLPEALKELKAKAPEHLWVFVGSEGGFSLAEVQLFAQHGLAPVSLGEQILRVETACLALASIIKYEFGR